LAAVACPKRSGDFPGILKSSCAFFYVLSALTTRRSDRTQPGPHISWFVVEDARIVRIRAGGDL
jgi:hypothetical protein